MFVPRSRISAILIVASVIGVTNSIAEDVLPHVQDSTPRLLLTAASKPQTVQDPRVFASGPVLSQDVQLPKVTPEIPKDVTEVIPKPPSDKVHLPEPMLPQQMLPETIIESSTAAAPVINHYYEPYVPSAQTVCAPRQSRDWASLETLIWWTSKTDTPVLASTSPIGTNPTQAGVLGGNTQSLFGGDEIFGDAQGGFRFRMGHFLNDCDGSGFTGEFFMLGSRGHDFRTSSDGDPIIARPFFNANTNAQDSQLISYPGSYRGSLAINAETKMYSVAGHYWGELYIDRCCNGCSGCSDSSCSPGSGCQQRRSNETQLGVKIGPRFMHLDDTLLIDETAVRINTGSSFRLIDSFKTENSFLGGEIGLRARRQRGPLDLELGLQLAIGATRQELDIAGLNTVTTGGVPVTTPGGLLALDSNSGSWDRDRFSLVPALELMVGYELKNGWRATVGYNLLYWTNVLRASEQIDGTLNVDQLAPAVVPGTGPDRPSVQFDETDYMAHGISFGLEKQW